MGERLERSAQDVLRAAAVLGAEFSPRELAVVLTWPSPELAVLLDEIVEAGLLRVDGNLLRFADEQLRRELYEAIPVALRMALHRYTAKILDSLSAAPERVARQLLAAGDEVERWEADWLVEHAPAIYALEPETAVELVGQVLRGLDPVDPRHATLEDRWAIYAFELGRLELAGNVARGILTHTDDPARVGPAVWVLALSLMTKRRFEEALSLLRHHGDRAGIPEFWRARNDAACAVVLEILGRLDEGRVAAERALAAEVAPPDPFSVGTALYLRSVVRAARRDVAGALDDVERGLVAVAQAPDLVDLRMLLLGNQYAFRFALGRHDGVPDAMRHVLDLGERTNSLWFGRIRRQAAELLYDLGRWDETTGHRAIGALVAAHRDDSAEVVRNLKALSEGGNETIYELAARALEGERSGSPSEAVATLSACLEPGAEDRFPLRFALLPKLARLALLERDAATARAAAEAARWEAGRSPRRASAPAPTGARDPRCRPGADPARRAVFPRLRFAPRRGPGAGGRGRTVRAGRGRAAGQDDRGRSARRLRGTRRHVGRPTCGVTAARVRRAPRRTRQAGAKPGSGGNGLTATEQPRRRARPEGLLES